MTYSVSYAGIRGNALGKGDHSCIFIDCEEIQSSIQTNKSILDNAKDLKYNEDSLFNALF